MFERMTKPPHLQAAYDMGAAIAYARRRGEPDPFPLQPNPEELWARFMGDAARSEWPIATLRHLRDELGLGYRHATEKRSIRQGRRSEAS